MRFILLLIPFLFLSCAHDQEFVTKFEEHFITKELISSGTGCGTEEDVEAYRLAELFFKNDEELTFRLNVVVFTNGLKRFSDEIIKTRISHVNAFFKEAKAGIQYEVDSITFITDIPARVPEALDHIKSVEDFALRGKQDDNLRSSFKMAHYRLWDKLYGRKDAITMYIYNDEDAPVAGVAGGIGATFFAMSLLYIHPQLKVIEHELGHTNGLWHTHQFDPSLKDTPYSGDRIAATPKAPILSNIIDDDCNLSKDWNKDMVVESGANVNSHDILKELSQKELDMLIKNVMSYSRGVCREEFLPSQVLRMRKIIETSSDLRKAIIGLEETYSDILWEEVIQ